jgi:phosphonoacetaldehyde hydrolase
MAPMPTYERSSVLQAVVFDWAGTLIDFGSCAPMGVFVKLFGEFGVAISIAEARAPMGLPKWQHIQTLGLQPRIAAQWLARHGKPFGDADVDRLYEIFTPMNAASVRDHAALVPRARETVDTLRQRGLKIGSTTGYNRPIMEVVLPLAAAAGLAPDNLVCAGDLPDGRPSPLMMYRCFADLGVWPPRTVVKVDDTAPGIAEGLNAGSWTVGIAVSGNAMGLTLAEWQALDATQQAARRAAAAQSLREAGAHYVIDSVADLLPVLDAIGQALREGRAPAAPH